MSRVVTSSLTRSTAAFAGRALGLPAPLALRRWPAPADFDGQDLDVIIDVLNPAQQELLDRASRIFCGAGEPKSYLGSGHAIAFVAARECPSPVDGIEIIGWCYGYVLPRPDGSVMAYLHDLEVSGAQRRCGYGRRLVQSFLQAAAGAGASKVFLVTEETNQSARSFYGSLGGTPSSGESTMTYSFSVSHLAAT